MSHNTLKAVGKSRGRAGSVRSTVAIPLCPCYPSSISVGQQGPFHPQISDAIPHLVADSTAGGRWCVWGWSSSFSSPAWQRCRYWLKDSISTCRKNPARQVSKLAHPPPREAGGGTRSTTGIPPGTIRATPRESPAQQHLRPPSERRLWGQRCKPDRGRRSVSNLGRIP
jgi:hypothetical protein